MAPSSGLDTVPEEVVPDIIILHYKRGMSFGSLSSIFSVEEEKIRHIITTFAGQFSNPANLDMVVEGMVKMKKNKLRNETEARPATLSPQEKEIAELRRQLKESEIKAEVYLEMIKVAEQVYNIPIRKKYGAK